MCKLTTEFLILCVKLQDLNLYNQTIICDGKTIRLNLLYTFSNYKIISKLQHKAVLDRKDNYYVLEVNIYEPSNSIE